MKSITCLLFSLFFLTNIFAQKWVDTTYSINTIKNIEYGSTIDFAGNSRKLHLDISIPNNDTPPPCGRPLIVVIHGGAFIAGNKDEASVIYLREHFAKRGYASVAVNYRLGQFHTSQQINCNVSGLGVEWNCLNMADTSEWYRAYYRGIQDINGAIRFLVNNKNDYVINPKNIFLVGESAGGFIAMGAGFIDDPSEVLSNVIDAFSKVKAPNSIYESPCIQAYGLDTSIASMNLSRPNLGKYSGDLNQPAQHAFTIRGVGSMFGAVFNNIFETKASYNPALYMFHQPNDLIVPFSKAPVFTGYVNCMLGFPFNCGYIVNRPVVYGSSGIKTMLDTLQANGKLTPIYQFDKSTNTAGCAQQFATPSLSGHTYDNFSLRTKNMAVFFAKAMDTCSLTNIITPKTPIIQLYPNPVNSGQSFFISGELKFIKQITITDISGNVLSNFQTIKKMTESNFKVSTEGISAGFYILRVEGDGWFKSYKVLIN